MNSHTIPYGVLVLRLALGVMYLAHAYLKIFTYGPTGTAQFFGSVGLPGSLTFTYLVIIAELGGGILLILGVYARYVALALLPLLLGATWIHWPNGWLHTVPNGGWEFPMFLIFSSVALFLLGDGAHALRPAFLKRTTAAQAR